MRQAASEFARAQAQFSRSIADGEAWKDDQRIRINRARIDPLVEAADRYTSELQQAAEAVDAAERLMGK